MSNYICIGTIPSRVDKIFPVIESIIKNNRFEKIILSIPKYFQRGSQLFDGQWPNEIIDLEKSGVLQLNVSEIDYGPGTKFIAPCQIIDDPNAQLIICDDDNLLNGPFSDQLINNVDENEILGFSGINVKRRFFRKDAYLFVENTDTLKRKVDVLQGYAGIIIKRSLISDRLINFYKNLALEFTSEKSSLLKALFLNDDVTLSMYAKINGINVTQFGNEFFNSTMIKPLKQSKIEALHENNLFGNNFRSLDLIMKNQPQLKKLLG